MFEGDLGFCGVGFFWIGWFFGITGRGLGVNNSRSRFLRASNKFRSADVSSPVGQWAMRFPILK